MRFYNLFLHATAALAACNGHDELCERKYSEVTFVGSHNSAFNGVLPVHNQYKDVKQQLHMGVRFLQMQTKDKDGDVELCHTSCSALDVGPLVDQLADIKIWMDENPDEVLTLLLTNGEALPVSKFDNLFESTGLKDFVFRPKGTVAKDDWPTLQQLINDDSRLVVFMDYNHDQDEVDYILDEFAHFWETPYGITDEGFSTCSVDRPDGGDTKVLMGIMNHMLNKEVIGIVYPEMDAAKTTNSKSSIQKQVDLCAKEHSVQPNIILLDWINVGDALTMQLSLNGL